MSDARCPVGSFAAYDYKKEPRIAHDLWNLAAEMADQPEVFWSDAMGGYWIAASAVAYEEASTRTDLFSNCYTSIPPLPTQPRLIPATLDPPEHTRYRKEMTQRMFSVRALEGLSERALELARALADDFIDDGACDFVEAFGRRLPVDLFLTMMGEPPERREAFLSWVNKIFHPRQIEELIEGRTEAQAFVGDWLTAQLAGDGNCGRLFQGLLDCRVEGRPLTRDEMQSMTIMLFLGGLDTVVSQLAHIFRFLAESPEHRRYVVEHPDRIPAVTEELLRRFGITNTMRMVKNDCHFRGADLRCGDMILLVTPFANLDRRVFDDPLKVDFERDGRLRHLAFGAGPHICIGAYLARTMIHAALAALPPRMRDLRMKPGADPVIVSGGTYGLLSLELEWTPA